MKMIWQVHVDLGIITHNTRDAAWKFHEQEQSGGFGQLTMHLQATTPTAQFFYTHAFNKPLSHNQIPPGMVIYSHN